MPQIEVVPNSTTSTSAPGWAYVPDTGYDPSKAPIVPSGARKRARYGTQANHAVLSSSSANAGTREALSARQQSKIDKHLAELDKDSHRDVQIVVPGKSRDVASRGLSKSGKMTQGVRKILSSQKTWANYLADEEAMLAAGGPQALQYPVAHLPKTPASEGRVTADLQRRGSGAKQVKTSGRKKRTSLDSKRVSDVDVMDMDYPATPSASETPHMENAINVQNEASLTPAKPFEDPTDCNPFLKSRIPALPTQAEIEALLAAPPLSYNAARAGPTTNTAPPRQFCEMCGYWGRVKCMKCGVRICGLECKRQHDETRCLKFYA